jgi:hypothetical protein
VGFCSVLWVQLFYFFSLSFKKNKCAASVLAYKNHDNKNWLQHRRRLGSFGFCVWVQALAVLRGWACSALLAVDVYIQLLGFLLN